MKPELIELSRRAVACKGWRWMPGMYANWIEKDVGWRILSERSSWYDGEKCEDSIPGGPNSLPDLTDPATLGCLLALVREAWGDPRLVAIYCEAANPGQSEGWAVQCGDNRLPVAGEDYPSEGEALIAALEAAP